MTKDEARFILVNVVEEFTESVGKRENISELFENKNGIMDSINFILSFEPADFSFRSYPNLGGIIFYRNKAVYFYFDKKGNVDSSYDECESYAEAYEIVRGEPSSSFSKS